MATHESFFRPVIKFISTTNGELETESHKRRQRVAVCVSLLHGAQVPVRAEYSLQG